MRITGAVLTAFALAAGLAAQQPPAPRPQATFRGGVTYVEVDAYVTNAHGDPVADLTANDFELIDAGSPQRITRFVAVNLSIPWRPLPAIWSSSGRAREHHAEGRIYLVVLDDLHVDGTRTPAVRTALRRFVEQDLGPTDMTAIVSTSGRLDASAEFTNDRRLLIDVIDRFMGQKLPSATVGQIQAARDERFQEGFKQGSQKKDSRLWPRSQCTGARRAARRWPRCAGCRTSWPASPAASVVLVGRRRRRRQSWTTVRATSKQRPIPGRRRNAGAIRAAPAATSPSMASPRGPPTPLLI
jgi:VWFA-related protein